MANGQSGGKDSLDCGTEVGTYSEQKGQSPHSGYHHYLESWSRKPKVSYFIVKRKWGGGRSSGDNGMWFVMTEDYATLELFLEIVGTVGRLLDCRRTKFGFCEMNGPEKRCVGKKMVLFSISSSLPGAGASRVRTRAIALLRYFLVPVVKLSHQETNTRSLLS